MQITLAGVKTFKSYRLIHLLKIVFLFCILLIAACNDNGTPSGNGLISTSTLNGGLLNGGLTGRVVTANRDLLPIEINLSTGTSRLLPLETIQSTFTDENWERGTIQGYFTANVDGSGYIQSIEKCRRRRDEDSSPINGYDSCVATYDSSFARQSLLSLPYTQIDGAAKLSRSGSYFAFNEYVFGGNSFSTLYIIDVNSRSLTEALEIPLANSSKIGDAPFAWGPSDTLVYSVPQDDRVTLYISNPLTWTPVNTITLPANLQGDVSSLEFSPDGSQILIGYDPPGLLSGVVLLLDLDTLTYTVPVIDARSIGITSLDEMKGNLVSPRWSPDGQYIMVVSEGSGAGPIIDVTTGSATVIAARNTLYAVPADASRTVVNGDQPTAAIAIAASRVTGGELTTSFPGMLTFDYPFYDWVP